MNNRLVKNIIFYVTISIVYIVLFSVFIASKNNFHVDELFSYGLSNCIGRNQLIGLVEEGKIYDDVDSLYMEYLSANPNDRFNYVNVWERQRYDTHPPLYYAILHTICSFFPGTFSIWYAGVINIIFGILIIFVLDKMIINIYKRDDYLTRGIIITCFVGPATHIATFLRMYMMVMFMITLVSYLIISHVDNEYKPKDYVMLYIISLCGALTHYYFIIYVGLICVAFGIVLISRKRKDELFRFCYTMIFAGMSSVLIFHTMVRHLIGGTRGSQSINNLINSSLRQYLQSLNEYISDVNNEVYGGMLLWIVLFLGIIALLNVLIYKRKYHRIISESLQKYLILLFSGIVFFLFVVKSAEMQSTRYISPIFAILYVLLWGVILYVVDNIKWKKMIVLLIGLCIVAGSLRQPNEYLYHGSTEFLNTVKNEYAGLDAVMVYTKGFKIQAEYQEVINYGSITYIYAKDTAMLSDLEELRNKDEFMLLVMKDKYVNRVLEVWPEFKVDKKVGECKYTITYHMVKE